MIYVLFLQLFKYVDALIQPSATFSLSFCLCCHGDCATLTHFCHILQSFIQNEDRLLGLVPFSYKMSVFSFGDHLQCCCMQL